MMLERIGTYFQMVFHLAADPLNILILLSSVLMGIMFGAMPGLTSTLGVALLTALTYGMDTSMAMVCLLAIYVGERALCVAAGAERRLAAGHEQARRAALHRVAQLLLRALRQRVGGQVVDIDLHDQVDTPLQIETQVDAAPLQVGQFESTAELMDQWLTWTYLEGRGGGRGRAQVQAAQGDGDRRIEPAAAAARHCVWFIA